MTETQTCPKCGAELPDNAPSGICPKCLMQVGLESGQDLGNQNGDLKPGLGLGSGPPRGQGLVVLRSNLRLRLIRKLHRQRQERRSGDDTPQDQKGNRPG